MVAVDSSPGVRLSFASRASRLRKAAISEKLMKSYINSIDSILPISLHTRTSSGELLLFGIEALSLF
jgi:hypothetical protein